jgi:chemotaxis regulatin CheY-phosphate phosphatase CheZ
MSATPIGAVLLSARRSSAMVPNMTAQDIRRMLQLLAAIESHLASIETLLAGLAKAIETVTVENLTIEPGPIQWKPEQP